MEDDIGALVQENARVARELSGVALLRVPQTTDPGWRMRMDALIRAEYPNHAPPSASNKEEDKKSGEENNALMLLPSAKSQGDASTIKPSSITTTTTTTTTTGMGVAEKRPRTEDSIISIDPKVLKSRMTAVSSTVVNAESRDETYIPPPSWKMSKVLVGHRGWVWSAAVDPSNSWFATGGGDAVVKVWDLTTGALKLNLTGHKEAVRAISLSTLSPYMFTGSDDRSLKCWDLERNEIIRDFHGHKGPVHSVGVHPSLDIVVSGGRDKTVRIWDVRTRSCVHLLVGHTDSVMSVAVQQADPQVISGGSDGMIYLWDIASGRAFTRLTRHKKPVRDLSISRQGTLVSCGADNIRLWSLPKGEFLFNASTSKKGKHVEKEEDAESYRWTCCAISPRNVLAVGSQEGKLAFYDCGQMKRPPYQFTKTRSIPGTLPGEGGINCIAFDASGTRLITAESDKSVKIWRTKE
ncbi:pleiotropic regulator 1 [Trypanosoma theileri]|uniref:Pleiotropic regulator 1 n=1 Tax=Trypanosoma theileri TaxID=67003 RepID=A0A1X0P0F0_9TRYP|nr:pleiotropic regulator 1 [Trypanosoma theileri]ORC90417.1 pleiotropic regulator 1 [Trypanosoma theileri]